MKKTEIMFQTTIQQDPNVEFEFNAFYKVLRQMWPQKFVHISFTVL